MKSSLRERFIFGGLCVILMAGLIFTYSNSFKNPFHFDDDHAIVNNVWIRNIGNIPKFFADGTTTSSLPQNQAYRPGLTTLNTIDYWIASKDPFHIGEDPLYPGIPGLKPFYFHLSIFICLIFQAVLMFLLFKKLLDITIKHRWNKYFALSMVALYCFHTALAETVNYIISRSDGFSTLMVMLALVIYVYYPQKRKYQFYMIPYIMGFFVKEPALMFGPIVFIYLVLFEKQVDLTKMFSKDNFKKILLSFASVIHILLIGLGLYLFEKHMTPKTWTGGVISTWDYLITQPFVVVQYFFTFIIPTELSADTDWKTLPQVVSVHFWEGFRMLLMGLMFVVGMLWLAVRLSGKPKLRAVSFGIFFFFIALIPTSSFFPLSEVLNDHRVFFPYIGLALAFATAIIYLIILRDEKYFLSSFITKFLTGVLVVGVIGSYAYGAHQRNKVWSSYESLWYDVTQKSPENGRGLMNYALSQMRKGDYVNAKLYFEKALKLIPNYSLLHINMGILYSALNDPDEAERYFKTAISIGTFIYQGYYYYGNFLYSQKRYDEAKVMLQNSIADNPAYTEARYSLMTLYNTTQDWGNLKRLAEETLTYVPGDPTCLAYIEASKNKKTKLDIALETIKTAPTNENYLNLSLYYFEAGMYNESINACLEAIKIKPDNALAYNNICSAYNQLKFYDKAIVAGKKALSINPDYELAKNNLKFAEKQLGQ